MKRIFISFAIDGKLARDSLVYQAKQERTPFEFTNMSVKEPWSSSWKTNCRKKIKRCDGVIAFISSKRPTADGERSEIKCAKEEYSPVKGLWIHSDDPCCEPKELGGTLVPYWAWAKK